MNTKKASVSKFNYGDIVRVRTFDGNHLILKIVDYSPFRDGLWYLTENLDYNEGRGVGVWMASEEAMMEVNEIDLLLYGK